MKALFADTLAADTIRIWSYWRRIEILLCRSLVMATVQFYYTFLTQTTHIFRDRIPITNTVQSETE